jgi:outer membrane lipoprotein-sorting protein
MKKSILFFIMLLAVALTGCKNYDEDIDKINARLAALETWEANVNINITALQTAVTALQGKDYVTKVVALSDGSGYQITFQNSGTITIKNGTDGKTV